MYLKLAAVLLFSVGGATSPKLQEKFGEKDGWTVESLQGGCSASRYFDKQRQTFSIVRTRSGQIQLTFIADRWKFADGERQDYGLRMFTPGGKREWQSLYGTEWSSGGAGFIRIAFEKDNAVAPLQDLAASTRLEIIRGGKQVARFDMPNTAAAVLTLFRCSGG